MGEIITILKNDVNQAEGYFRKLMEETESILNMRGVSQKWMTTTKALTASSLEKEAENAIKTACQKVTEFDANEVELKSGHKFPDILAEKYYGVEVKSTISDQWKSTGSSIVESTRIDTVESVYMLFGKLGGKTPEFRCRPYKEVMYDIAVTHSPRYLINMNLKPGETIFDKLNCEYDCFRKDPDAIKRVKQYYKRQNTSGQMPWWIDDDDNEPMSMPINIRLWKTLPSSEKSYLKSLIFVLFPEVVQKEYGNAALWLASAKGIVNPNIRDLYTAGGTVNPITWKSMGNGVPRIWKTLYECRLKVKSILEDLSVRPYIEEYNPDILVGGNVYDKWVDQIKSKLNSKVIEGREFSISSVLYAL